MGTGQVWFTLWLTLIWVWLNTLSTLSYINSSGWEAGGDPPTDGNAG